MSTSITLDYLISQNGGDTFYFDDATCSESLLKEAILRGFQVQNLDPCLQTCQDYGNFGRGLGDGRGEDDGDFFFGFGDGFSSGYGNEEDSGNGWGGSIGDGCFGKDGITFGNENSDEFVTSLPAPIKTHFGVSK